MIRIAPAAVTTALIVGGGAAAGAVGLKLGTEVRNWGKRHDPEFKPDPVPATIVGVVGGAMAGTIAGGTKSLGVEHQNWANRLIGTPESLLRDAALAQKHLGRDVAVGAVVGAALMGALMYAANQS